LRLRACPEDFRVDEVALYPAAGHGAHTFVRVEKRGLTTEQVARALARAAGVRPRDVGYAGRKDRDAVARQWLSVPGLAPERALALEAPGLRVLEATPHPHKLRTGQLRANRFEIVVRELDAEEVAAAPARLEALAARGMPNRFGAQRFGREGRNAERGRELLAGGARPRDARDARFLLSALQAEVFNTVLAERPVPPDVLEEGDVAWVHASGACFLVEDAQAEAPRAARFEISASGPLFGTRLLVAQGRPGAREREVFARLGVPPPEDFRAPRGLRARGARRPLRVRPEEARCEPEGPSAVRLAFTLPPGSFATVLVETLFGGGGMAAGVGGAG
jgi:tRNA pseudouridine13 synthase